MSKKNPYEHKGDMQLMCLALHELLNEKIEKDSRLSDYADLIFAEKMEDMGQLSTELRIRGCEVKKASKHWPDEEIEKRDFKKRIKRKPGGYH